MDNTLIVIPLENVSDLDKRLREFIDTRGVGIESGSNDFTRLRNEALQEYLSIYPQPLQGDPAAAGPVYAPAQPMRAMALIPSQA